MTSERSKRRDFLALVFISKSISKKLLIKNEMSFSYERMGTKTRFKKEAKGNSEMARCYRDSSSSTQTYAGLRTPSYLAPCKKRALNRLGFL